MRAWLSIPLLLSLGACLVGDGEDDEDDGDLVDTSQQFAAFATTPGVNSNYCTASPYNCRFHEGSSRVVTQGGSESWGIDAGASVRDGDGTVLATETGATLTFNFGQTRALAGKAHALALTTSNGSAGWYPIDHIKGETSFRGQVGEVNAKDPKAGKMACYQIKNAGDSSIELKKVVYDSQEPASGHERAGDYLPEVRANGKRSANLVFSVPGFALGGATTDHFLAGAKFQRVEVPTASGRPSISIPLWVKDSAGRYRKQSGSMRFLYGYVVSSADGVKRFGWMAQDALDVASGCP
ncbi:MAG TPA: hypothetical protein VGM88_24305 [Kofleriaceae bacterium]|jgi:hypothetical protein